MSKPDAHWTRPLKGGYVEFFMRLNGGTMQGSATPTTYRDLKAMFEESQGGVLPESEEKPMRGGRRAQEVAG
jgi:hypothetical protein